MDKRRIALALTLVVGAVLGSIVGFIVASASNGAGGGSGFRYWLYHPLSEASLWWAIGGAGIATAIVYIRRTL